LEFLEILLNLRKFLMSSLSEFYLDNIEEFMIKEVRNMDTQEFNLHRVYQALIPIE
jgi:isoleucyl-tRNA synthetase